MKPIYLNLHTGDRILNHLLHNFYHINMISGLEHVNALGYSYSNDVSQRVLTPSSVESNPQTVWSDVSSLSSSESSISSEPLEDGPTTASQRDQYAIAACAPHESFDSANGQSRHPRRTACTAGTIAPPALLRQSDRKVNFVDNLVGKQLEYRCCPRC